MNIGTEQDSKTVPSRTIHVWAAIDNVVPIPHFSGPSDRPLLVYLCPHQWSPWGLPGIIVSLGVSRSLLTSQLWFCPFAPSQGPDRRLFWAFLLGTSPLLSKVVHFALKSSLRLLALCSAQIYALGKSRGQSRGASRETVMPWTAS